MVLELLKVGAVAAAILIAFLYFYQERMLFYPTPVTERVPKPVRGEVEALRLRTPDGAELSGWFVASGVPRAPLVIYFGGNAEDVSWMIGAAGRLDGHSLMLLEYRGYGRSEGRPGEAALFADALLAYDFAIRRGDVDPARIIAMGRSLGSGVAVHLAAHRPVAGVVLVSPYDSVRALAQSAYPWLPVSALLKHRFDSLSPAAALSMPLLCLVAERESVIPHLHSRRLFDAWGAGQKRWVEVPRTDHNTLSDDPRYWEEIVSFLSNLAVKNP